MPKKGANLPDPRNFPDELTQILAVLFRAEQGASEPWVATARISSRLLDEFGISINVRRVYSVLSAHPKLAARRKRNSQWEFRILDTGRKELVAPPGSTFVIDPSHPVPALIKLHEFLAELRGEVRISDPYLDPVTMSHLDACGQGVRLRLLTARIHQDATVRAAVRSFARLGRSIEIKRSTSGRVHDRYIIEDRQVFYLGTSLNGIGKTNSSIIPLGSDARRALVRQFDEEWGHAQVWQ
jgi:hypothetical protein